MAKGNGQKRITLAERVKRIEEGQQHLEAEVEESELEINKLIDRHDKNVRLTQRQIREIVGMHRQVMERAIEIYEMQEKAEIRLDRQQEQSVIQQEQLAMLSANVDKLTVDQAETTRKLNQLIELDRRWRSNGSDQKPNGKKKSK
jgi:hypothetical protein